jgi:hypothetical protein
MRALAIALAAGALLAAAAPASAQTVYVDDGYWGGPTYGYRSGYNWGPGVEARVGAPRARIYVEEDLPRYRRGYAYADMPRYRRGYVGRYYDDYAYAGGYRSWGGPTVTVGGWRSGWDWDR